MIPYRVDVAVGGRTQRLLDLNLPLDLKRLLPPQRAAEGWEMELGFGKGRHLLTRAAGAPSTGFLGIEIAGRYQRLAASRAARRGLGNLVLLRGEASYLLAVVLPRRFARAVHVYFPDPWPKKRHQKRRFLDRQQLDLVLGAMVPGGKLFFATDFLAYGEQVSQVLRTHPRLSVVDRSHWPEGPRTNYEAKYVAEGRPILRLEATLDSAADEECLVHPAAVGETLVGPGSAEGADDLGLASNDLGSSSQEPSSAADTSANSSGAQ